jgi:hypothetical protein
MSQQMRKCHTKTCLSVASPFLFAGMVFIEQIRESGPGVRLTDPI